MNVLSLLTDPNAWAALITLTALEIVLGIDNLVFISVLTARLEADKARRARQVGLSLAFIFRVIMLAGLTWLMGLTAPLFTVFRMGISWRDIILVGGGLFLIAKATHEIHSEVEARESATAATSSKQAFAWIVVQLVAIDLVFSLDSIITAIGMAEHLEVMIAAVVIAMIVMYAAAAPVGVHRGAPHHQDAGARLSGADRGCAGGRRLRVPYSARIYLFRHGVCRRGRGIQRHSKAQPAASAADLTA